MPIIPRNSYWSQRLFPFSSRIGRRSCHSRRDSILRDATARDRPGHTVNRHSSDNEDWLPQIFLKNLMSARHRFDAPSHTCATDSCTIESENKAIIHLRSGSSIVSDSRDILDKLQLQQVYVVYFCARYSATSLCDRYVSVIIEVV